MRYLASLMLAASLCGVPAMMGCDEEVSHERKVETSGGGSKVEDKTVTQHSDGTVTKTEEKKTVNP